MRRNAWREAEAAGSRTVKQLELERRAVGSEDAEEWGRARLEEQ